MSAVRILAEELELPDFNPLEQALHAWDIRKSDPKESHRIALDLIDHALEFDEPLVTGWAYLTCGVHEGETDLDRGEETLDSAARVFARVGERRGESLSLVVRARLLMKRGDFRRALELYKSIIEREAHGLQSLEKFEAFNGIAACFWGLDKIDLSLLYLSRAFDIVKNGDRFGTQRATVLGNMGAALISVGNYQAAYEFLNAAISACKNSADRSITFNAYASLVSCLLELNETAKAVRAATHLIREYQEMLFASPNNVGWCNAAIAFARAKHFAMADQCLLAAHNMADTTKVGMSVLLVAHAEALVAEARGNFAVAIAHAEALLESFKDELPHESKAQLLLLLVNCNQQIGAQAAAFGFKKKKLELAEERYQSGLTAAMVILDLQSHLKSFEQVQL